MHLNVGTGVDISIKDLAGTIAKIVGFEGQILWDTNKPDGTPRKVLDISRIKELGWEPIVDLASGIQKTVDWFIGARIANEVRL